MINHKQASNTLYLIYDHECPLCRHSAQALRIKKTIGNLVIINAREAHPMIVGAYERGLDPDKGIIVIYQEQYFFGTDAVQLLSALSSHPCLLTKLLHFRSTATSLYTIVKGIRRIVLSYKGIHAIEQNLGLPLFASVLGNDWRSLPKVLKQRYRNRPYSNDRVTVIGMMTIADSLWMKLLRPFLTMSGALIQKSGKEIPVEVTFISVPESSKYYFERIFKFKKSLSFKSYMSHIKDNIMVEYMKFNVGWRFKVSVDDQKVTMSHYGYVFRFFTILVPLPLELLLGKCHAQEYALSDTTFGLHMSLNHFLFGEIYLYKGEFKVDEHE